MYRLLKPLPSGLSVMVKEFEEYVKKRGHEAIACLQYDNIPQQFVDNILTVGIFSLNMKMALCFENLIIAIWRDNEIYLFPHCFVLLSFPLLFLIIGLVII